MDCCELSKVISHFKGNTPVILAGRPSEPLMDDGKQQTARSLFKWLLVDPTKAMVVEQGEDKRQVACVQAVGEGCLLFLEGIQAPQETVRGNQDLLKTLGKFKPSTSVFWRTDAQSSWAHLDDDPDMSVGRLLRWLRKNGDDRMIVRDQDDFVYTIEWVEVAPQGLCLCAWELTGQQVGSEV